MSAPKVFLDSGIFVAFLNHKDRNHAQARALFSGPKPRWSTSMLVRSEAYSWFLHKYGEEAARSFRQLVDDLQIFDATTKHHDEVCKMLDRLRGTKLTYVDASSLALMDRHKITRVWSTDRHLGLTGAEVLPRI